MHSPTEDLRDAVAQRETTLAQAAASNGDVSEAQEHMLAARDADDGRCESYLNLAELAISRAQYDIAVALLKRALVTVIPFGVKPGMIMARLGNALWHAQRYAEARSFLQRAVVLCPDEFLTYHNLGLLDYYVGDPIAAERSMAKALTLAPNNPFLKTDYAQAVLKTGELKRGLRLFESRWQVVPKSPAWDCGLPLWSGAYIVGEHSQNTLLLHAEQGFGDTLQFIRFVPMIRKSGGFSKVIFAGPLALKRLIEGQCEVSEYFDFDKPGDLVRAARIASYHCPLISAVSKLDLEYALFPEPRPYLEVFSGSPRELRPGGARLAIGLVWAASVGHERSRQRSVKVTDLLSLGTVPGVKLWSLQMAPYAKEAIETGAELMVSDATLATMDFADMAGIVNDMDVIVTVDTAMVHLAGAIGKRCYMLNPVNACWRWCRGAAPWYKSVTIVNQSPDLSWARAIETIRGKLASDEGRSDIGRVLCSS